MLLLLRVLTHLFSATLVISQVFLSVIACKQSRELLGVIRIVGLIVISLFLILSTEISASSVIISSTSISSASSNVSTLKLRISVLLLGLSRDERLHSLLLPLLVLILRILSSALHVVIASSTTTLVTTSSLVTLVLELLWLVIVRWVLIVRIWHKLRLNWILILWHRGSWDLVGEISWLGQTKFRP